MKNGTYEFKDVIDITDFITLVNCNESVMITNLGYFHAKFVWSWGLNKIESLIKKRLLKYSELKMINK